MSLVFLMQKNSLSLCSVLTSLNSFCVGCFSSQVSSEFFPAIITLPFSRLSVSHLALLCFLPKQVTIVVLLWQDQPISKSLSRAILLESSCSAVCLLTLGPCSLPWCSLAVLFPTHWSYLTQLEKNSIYNKCHTCCCVNTWCSFTLVSSKIDSAGNSSTCFCRALIPTGGVGIPMLLFPQP